MAILGGDEMLKIFFVVPVWLFNFISGGFQTVCTKRMYSSPIISLCTPFACMKQMLIVQNIPACSHSQIVVQNVVRILHFSTSSLLEGDELHVCIPVNNQLATTHMYMYMYIYL